jgi:hypothetical protein
MSCETQAVASELGLFPALCCNLACGVDAAVSQESLHVSKPTWWLESRFHFSFADYWGKCL